MITSDVPFYRLIDYHKEEKYLEYNLNHQTFRFVDKKIVENNYLNKTVEIVSDDIKILIALHPRMFHLFIDNLAEIIYYKNYFKTKLNKNVKFILETSDIMPEWFSENSPTYFKFFLKVLKDVNIDYVFINTQPFDLKNKKKSSKQFLKNNNFIKLDNFYLWKPTEHREEIFQILSELFKKYLLSENIVNDEPTKVVYLTRIVPKDIEEKGKFNNQRSSNEKEIEKFFKDNGCEIIAPEMFDTFEEQIKYFSSVKTLIALTGTGMINMLMMKDGGNIIELYTPISGNPFNLHTLTVKSEVKLHSFYRDFAWVKDHTHISIKNNYVLNGLDEKIIQNLQQNKILNMFFNNNGYNNE